MLLHICTKYNDSQRAILEMKNDLNHIPKLKSKNEVENLKKAKDIVESANLAINSIETGVLFFTTNLIQAVASKFYYRAQWKMLAKIKTFPDLVTFIDDLYENALRYDYNKLRKDDFIKKFEQSKNFSTAAISFNQDFKSHNQSFNHIIYLQKNGELPKENIKPFQQPRSATNL